MPDLSGAVERLVRALLKDFIYLTVHGGQIVAQSSDLATCDIRPDNQAIPDIPGAKIYWGIAGAKAKITSGRCLFGWENGDPSRPYCFAFDASVSELQLGDAASNAVIASGLKNVFDAHTHTHPQGPTGPPAVPLVVSSVSSTKVMV